MKFSLPASNRVTLLPGEITVLKLRKHWIILLRDTIGTMILAFVPLLLFGILEIFAPASTTLAVYLPFTGFLFSLWLLVIWMALAVIWTDYYLDLWIVTDRRIISVDQISLFNRKVTTLMHDRIQEIIVKEENFIQAFFHYGKLDIETASPTEHDATMEGIPEPERVRRVILDQAAKKTTISL